MKGCEGDEGVWVRRRIESGGRDGKGLGVREVRKMKEKGGKGAKRVRN